MSDREESKSASPAPVEVLSDAESVLPLSDTESPNGRRLSVIEVQSDGSYDEDVEILSETNVQPASDELEITGHQTVEDPPHIEYPGGPAVRPRSAEPTPRRNVRRRRNPPNIREFYQTSLLRGGQDMAILSNADIPELLLQHQREIMLALQERHNGVSASIMERINREEESTMDRKMELENIHNRQTLRKKQAAAKSELEGYTNSIIPDTDLSCELCGVVLGEGIPHDFVPDPKNDDDLEKHAAECRVNAPWFCFRQLTDIDKELSKRVFVAKCGHVFCGRCIKNIGNRPPMRRGKKEKQEKSTLNPLISAPRKCPAPECGQGFTNSKSTFTELFI